MIIIPESLNLEMGRFSSTMWVAQCNHQGPDREESLTERGDVTIEAEVRVIRILVSKMEAKEYGSP